ncbi:MAG: hypothetical protein H3C26_09025 [Rhodocyclaceae bacterium]|nr:hypothetical protein [Rhodocyclaceae bacterium]
MKPEPTLLAALRGDIVGCAAMLLAAGALAWSASAHLQAATADWQAAQRLHADAAATLAAADGEDALAQRLAAGLAALRATGALGDERRPEWLRLLATAAAARHLPPPACEMSPPRTDGDGLLRSTRMRLRATLLHEGDLLGLIDEAQTRAPAVVQVRACRLERLPAETATAARLRADCQLDWHTFAVTEEAR